MESGFLPSFFFSWVLLFSERAWSALSWLAFTVRWYWSFFSFLLLGDRDLVLILRSGVSDRCLFLLWWLVGLLDGLSCSFFFSLITASFRLTVATVARLEA